jgi:hypothetical protein
MEKHLHIISFDVPYPADYGGVIDVFYKIKTLHELGIKIHLHCFEYGRGRQPELNSLCEDVHYYHRSEGHKGFSHKLPYIVCSRSSVQLSENLLADDYPVLLEGIHCTYLLYDPRFAGRMIILRLHNVEYKYYRQLFLHEKSLFKKIYYWHESRQLQKYERDIAVKPMVIAFTEGDARVYHEEFNARRVFCLSAFLPFEKVENKVEKGCFCLYHGNLSVAENEAAVIWLLKKVFNDIPVPFVIAGKSPSPNLVRQANSNAHACLISDPSEPEMQDLIAKAQVNVLPSFNCTGIKLKLLNALFNGKHCIVNEETVKGTPLKPICHICGDAESFKQKIEDLYNKTFDVDEIYRRQEILSAHFDNKKNGEQLIKWIW